MKKLNLGLKAYGTGFHYPVIKTAPYLDPKLALPLWESFTHILFTSQSTIYYWPGPWDKIPIAIGPATAAALKQKELSPLIAPEATQEGLIELLKTIPNGHFFYPHSRKARPLLASYMEANKIPFFSLELYDTVFQKLEPVPRLEEFDELVFTSPSTVEGFLQIYEHLPKDKKLTAIGPITQAALERAAFI